MAPNKDIAVERLLSGLLLAGVAVGCIMVLQPFLSAVLWAAILVFKGVERELSGYDPATTNNRMELTAAAEALGERPEAEQPEPPPGRLDDPIGELRAL